MDLGHPAKRRSKLRLAPLSLLFPFQQSLVDNQSSVYLRLQNSIYKFGSAYHTGFI